MSKRSTLVLSVIAASLLGLVLLDRGRVSSGERQRRRGRVLESLVRERLDRIELESSKGERLVLEAKREEPGAPPTWSMLEPIRSEADQDAVSALVSELDWAEPSRRLRAPSKEDLKRFGLLSPRIRLRLKVGSESLALRIGGEDPTGAGAYAQVEGTNEVLIVRRQLVETLSRPPSHYRIKDVFPHLPVEEVARLLVAGEQGHFRLERKGRRWWLREPAKALAASARVSEMLRALQELRAQRFPEEDPAASSLGFDAPWLEVRVGLGEEERVLRVGAPCGGHEGERYARQGGKGPLVCVRESALAPFRLDPASLRDPRLLDAELLDVARIEVQEGGRRTVIERAEQEKQGDGEGASSSGWHLRSDDFDGEVSEDYVRRFLGGVVSARAERFEAVEEAAIRRHGLSSPALRFRVEFVAESEREPEVSLVGAAERSGDRVETWVRREGEPLLLVFPGDLAASLLPSPPAEPQGGGSDGGAPDASNAMPRESGPDGGRP